MITFLRFGVFYFLLAVVIVMLTRDDPSKAATAMVEAAWNISSIIGVAGLALGLVGMRYHTLAGTQSARKAFKSVALATIAITLVQGGFTLNKASMPHIVPFYTDPFLANLDRVMHGGTDPWIFIHNWADALPMRYIYPNYIQMWLLPCLLLPAIIVALDSDVARIRRTIVLYVVGWVVIGNILALAVMSVGPVYYDRLIGGDRFADLTERLRHSELAGSSLAKLQNVLWQVYAENGEAVGAGISAFPSVHLSMATVVGLYLYERGRLLGVLGALFVLMILFLSVYTGYHYAIDGYFSIAVIMGLWLWLRRDREAQGVQTGEGR